MIRMQKLAPLAILLTLAFLATPVLAKKNSGPPTGKLDEGRLDPAWFGGPRSFVETEEVDYFWAAEGFSAEGRTFHFQPWEEPQFLGEDAEDRDGNDRRLAREMNPEMPRLFVESLGPELGGPLATSLEQGDIVVTGRIVDCSTGSVAAKAFVGWGAGAGNVTIDLKFVDSKSGEMVAALHHRVVSGTNWSTSDSKFVGWVDKLADELKDHHGFVGLYKSGDRVKE
jgi:uncharacterized protein DUF4410